MAKVRIQMVSTVRGHDVDKNGVTLAVKTYVKNEVYEVGASLANTLMKGNAAVLANADSPPPSNPTTVQDPRPSGAPVNAQNKMQRHNFKGKR